MSSSDGLSLSQNTAIALSSSPLSSSPVTSPLEGSSLSTGSSAADLQQTGFWDWQDARIDQILFLSLFLLLGLGTRDWTLHLPIIGVAIVTCSIVQLSLERLLAPQKGGIASLPSALITALGLSLLLRVDRWETMALAATAAIASKFVLRVQGKHIFNPGNFGIITALMLTQDAWVSPGQWGESAWFASLFLLCGGVVLRKVGRWDTTIAFLGIYAGLELGRNIYLGWTGDVLFHRLMNGSLVMFALFMITDPRTIPNAKVARLIWAGAIAVLTFVLRNFFFVNTAVFWALFCLAPLTIVFDRIWLAERFGWKPSG
ncbi:MAG: RnfABCDGE type electron transport complex subunit D [Synechococcales bacterium]|nr:RnfABCDGE type electron transport complex subunit D [Synechococcales bacterium]